MSSAPTYFNTPRMAERLREAGYTDLTVRHDEIRIMDVAWSLPAHDDFKIQGLLAGTGWRYDEKGWISNRNAS